MKKLFLLVNVLAIGLINGKTYWFPQLLQILEEGMPGTFKMTSGPRAGWQRTLICRYDFGKCFYADLRYHSNDGTYDYYDYADAGNCGDRFQTIATAIKETDEAGVCEGMCAALGYGRPYPDYNNTDGARLTDFSGGTRLACKRADPPVFPLPSFSQLPWPGPQDN